MQMVLPSGMVTEARKIQGREIEALAAATERRATGTGVAKILHATWLSTEVAGPYKYGTGAMDWRFVASGDVLSALIQHRIAVRGPSYDFSARCEKCGHRNEQTVRLDELVMQPFPESTVERLKANLPLEAAFPDGRKFTFGMDCIEREDYLTEQLKQLKRRPEWRDHTATWIDRVAARMRSIEDFEHSNQFMKRLELLLGMDADYLYPVKEAIDAADCGVDTGVEFICEECHWKQEEDFPLGAAFFNPRTQRELKRAQNPKEMIDSEETPPKTTSEIAPS